MPLLNYIEFAGIHTDPSFASEGTALLNSLSALMTRLTPSINHQL